MALVQTTTPTYLYGTYNSVTKRVDFTITNDIELRLINNDGDDGAMCGTYAADRFAQFMLCCGDGFKEAYDSDEFPNADFIAVNVYKTSSGTYFVNRGTTASVDAKYFNSNMRGKPWSWRNCTKWSINVSDRSKWYIDCGVGDYVGHIIFNYCSIVDDNEAVSFTMTNYPPLTPTNPTITKSYSCINDVSTNTISIVTPNTTNVNYFSFRKSTTLNGTYTEVAKKYVSGGTYTYNDTTNVDGYYKVYACNDLYITDYPSNILQVSFAPVIEANVSYDDYPNLTFTAETTNFCDDVDNVLWYLDGTLIGSSTNNIFSSVLPNEGIIYNLTAKYVKNNVTGNTSNAVELSFLYYPTPILSGFTSNGTMVIPSGFNRMDVLMVGGGGYGGYARGNSYYSRSAWGGGGGAGGVLITTILNPNNGSYPVVIGQGGNYPTSPTNSTFYGLTANAGHNGANGNGYNSTAGHTLPVSVNTYGSGSGGGGFTGMGSGFGYGSTGTPPYGNNGASGTSSRAGGGGGYVSAGSGGSGGSGGSVSITGISPILVSYGGGTRSSAGNGSNATGIGYGGGGAASTSDSTYTGGDGGDGIVYVYLYSEYPEIPIAPSGLSSTFIDCDSIELTWVNNDTTEIDGNYIKQKINNSWIIIGTVSSNTTTFTVTGLTPSSAYEFRITSYNGLFTNNSDSYIATTLSAVPFNLDSTTNLLTAYVTWEINDPDYGISIIPKIRKKGTSLWTSGSTLANNATGYTFTNLSWNTIYQVEVTRIGSEYTSIIHEFTTDNFQAPSNLVITSIQPKEICFDWTNNGNFSDSIDVYYQKKNLGWNLFTTISGFSNTVCVTGLSMIMDYSFRVANNYNIYSLYSSTVNGKTSGVFLQPFCESKHYNVTGSTCGNNDGIIEIEEDYINFYNFTLKDINNNSYILNDYSFTGLSSNYYQITATPKSDYIYHYGYNSCYINWIKVEDIDTPMSLLNVSIKPQQCQPFDIQYGRIFYNISGLTSGHTYSFYAFLEDLSLYYSKTGITTTNDFLLANAKAQCYYSIIIDEVTNCHLLLNKQCINNLTLFSQGGIKKLYITPWSDDIDYNYWSTADDDYFLEFADTSFFTSTKIKEFFSLSGGTIQWYEIPVIPKSDSISQKLDKVREGYIFTDTLNIAIAKANAMKWTEISTILNPNNKWVFIVKDNNNFYWTGGYRHGAKIETYNFKTGARNEDNGYGLTFSSVSENKLLTSIDEDYIKNI